MNPISASGVKARYKMPALRPFAGFSPSCCAVRVHTEHWASEDREALIIRIAITSTSQNFRLRIILQNYGIALQKETSAVNIQQKLSDLFGRSPATPVEIGENVGLKALRS